MKIDVVLMLYKREYFLETQLKNIVNQTYKENIKLHIISNNENIKFFNLIKSFTKDLDINFIQKNNENKFLERHMYAYENNFKYVIFLDDDFLLNKDAVEKLYNTKKEKTFITFYGRNFKYRENLNKLYEKNQPTPMFTSYKNFNYGGPGFSILDCSIYSKFFKVYNTLEKDVKNNVDKMDDIFLSWIIDTTDSWEILNSHIVPENFPNKDDKFSSYLELMKFKNNMCFELNKLNNWKVLQ
jgi:hypothetical protein